VLFVLAIIVFVIFLLIGFAGLSVTT
jgi:hypothetical protein